MICPSCGTRWAPYRIDHIQITNKPHGEQAIEFLKPEYEKEYQLSLDNDTKVPCRGCSV